MAIKNYIETESRPICPACGGAGILLYNGLKDRIFDTPNEWSLKKCNNSDCGTLWLDPTPKEESIPLLYESYSTHHDHNPTKNISNKILRRINNAFLYQQYGYGHKPSLADKLLKLIIHIHPAWKDIIQARIFYIPFKKNGALLDVGCGSGASMVNMQKMGWKVVGVEPDPQAVSNARNKGVEVYQGDLYSQKFPDNSFDAILLSHVIEHVPFPDKLIKECHRILKDGGTLLAITPNAASRGSRYFGKNWRGLETPQHLQIFTPQSLALLAKNAGFKNIKSFSSPHGDLPIIKQSIELTKHEKINLYPPVKNSFRNKLVKHLSLFLYGWLNILTPNRSEIAALIAKK